MQGCLLSALQECWPVVASYSRLTLRERIVLSIRGQSHRELISRIWYSLLVAADGTFATRRKHPAYFRQVKT